MPVKSIFAVLISFVSLDCASRVVQASTLPLSEPSPVSSPTSAKIQSCLSSEEKTRILKAYEMARYYKYYDSLVKGQDSIEIVEVEKLEDVVVADYEYRAIFRMVLRIRIDDATFDRTFTIPIFYSRKEAPDAPKGVWAKVKADFWKFGTGFALGTLTGIGICAAK